MVDEPRRRGLRSIALDNLTTVVSAVAAFILFTGNGYYSALLRRFGLKPGLLALSQVEIATMGVYSTIYALPAIILEYWRSLAVGITIPTVLAVIWLVAKGTVFGKWLARGLVKVDNFSVKHPYLFIKLPVVVFFSSVGVLAGFKGGEHDAEYISHARKNSTLCYAIGTRLYRGVILAQDQNRTILVHLSRVSLVKNDDIRFISVCP